VIVQSFKMAMKAILSNKARSMLTMLGIIIGVLAVTVLVSLVSSTTDEVTGQIEDLGSNMLVVNVTSDRYTPLKLKDVETLKEIDTVYQVSPSLTGKATAKFASNTFDATVEGTTSSARDIRKWNVDDGRFLMIPDIENNTPVAVIGVNVADELFSDRSQAVGKQILVDGIRCRVIGMLEEQGSSVFGSDDDKIIVPYTLAQRMYPSNGIRTIYISATGSETVDAAEDSVNTFLMKWFRNDDDAFSVLNQSSILDMMSTVMGLMTALLGGIAAISLVVGGIGIMNIMLVSVTERTREIGIRKAIGASRGNILTQFLIEALMIGAVGGVIGLGLSYIVLNILSGIMNMAINISAGVITLSLGFSVGVGLIFGIYPANKASRLHPIEALRYEG